QLSRNPPCPCFQSRIGEYLVGAHGVCGKGGSEHQHRREDCRLQPAHAVASSAAVRRLRRAGAPTRSRRSSSDSVPPAIITRAPSQISVTSGFRQARTTIPPSSVLSPRET